MQYHSIVLAGTFDHLHQGHKKFISSSLAYCRQAYLGISTDWVRKTKKFSHSLQPYKQRLKEITQYLAEYKLLSKTNIFPLTEHFALNKLNHFIEAISVTKETYRGAQQVNQTRLNQGSKPLPIISIDLVKAQDETTLSSTQIRGGNINRKGLVYRLIFKNHNYLFLPKKNRQFFKQPLGKLLKGSQYKLEWAGNLVSRSMQKNSYPYIITVGDIATKTLFDTGTIPNLSIIDYRCQRQPIPASITNYLPDFTFRSVNIAGTINNQAANIIAKGINKMILDQHSVLIKIKGEEDLLVLPAILFAPLNTAIYYGQPNQGLVEITVDEALKNKAVNYLQMFQYV